MPHVYHESFTVDAGGWYGQRGNLNGLVPLERAADALVSRSPWWIDYNHAPPGAGYMHLLFCLNTAGPQTEAVKDIGGLNRFIAGGFSTDFTNARITFRLKGELLERDAGLTLLIQGIVEGICSGWLLTGQTLDVSGDWSEQCVTLVPDESQWTALGSRHDRTDTYGVKPLKRVLANVSTNIMLVLYPLEIAPMGPHNGDLHTLRAGRDYPVWRYKLPEGYVMLDDVRIELQA